MTRLQGSARCTCSFSFKGGRCREPAPSVVTQAQWIIQAVRVLMLLMCIL